MINMLRSISAMLTAGVSLNGFMSTAQGTKRNESVLHCTRSIINTHSADDLCFRCRYASQGNWAGQGRETMAVNRYRELTKLELMKVRRLTVFRMINVLRDRIRFGLFKIINNEIRNNRLNVCLNNLNYA